jgi:uncharacterized protein with PIN domain
MLEYLPGILIAIIIVGIVIVWAILDLKGFFRSPCPRCHEGVLKNTGRVERHWFKTDRIEWRCEFCKYTFWKDDEIGEG